MSPNHAKMLCISFILITPFVISYAYLMETKVFESKTTINEHIYTFNNSSQIRPIFKLGDLPFVVTTYSEFQDYDGVIYIYNKNGYTEGGGLFSRYIKYPSELYIYYISDGMMYGIVFENEYDEPLRWYKDGDSIYVIETLKESKFRFDFFILAISVLTIGFAFSFNCIFKLLGDD